MDNDQVGYTATMGDVIRVRITVGSQSHLKRVWIRFVHEIEGPRKGIAHIESTGDVINYQAEAAGRSNQAEIYIDTQAATATGEYRLEDLEVLTASDRWLPVTGVPPIFLVIKPEPQDDTPTYEGMTFYDVP